MDFLTSAAALSPPECPESLPALTDHGFGLDDDQRIPPALPDTTQENQDHAVTVLQRRALLAPAQHLELVTGVAFSWKGQVVSCHHGDVRIG
jgi:hypothetical protein